MQYHPSSACAIIGATILASSFASGPTEASSAHGKSRGAIRVDGHRRSYLLHVPRAYNKDKAVPLVLVFHGAFGSPRITRWDSRMSEQAEVDNFIVAYPNAMFGTWNAGLCCGISYLKNIDDVAFVSELIKHLKQRFNIDPNRVYVAGVSNGGMMAYKLGRHLSDQIAAIAPIEGCMYANGDSSVSSPISVIAFHGSHDPVIPYDGGVGKWLGYKLRVPSVKDTIQFWVNHDSCDSKPLSETANNITKETYANGRGNTEVCLYTLNGGGHIWPGGRRALLTGHFPERDLSATKTMCEFFLSHPKEPTNVNLPAAR